MFMRVTWGKIKAGQWEDYEKAYKKATDLMRDFDGLEDRYLVQDLADPDAGFSITLWDSEEHMRGYRDTKIYKEQVLPLIEPFFVDKYTTTFCKIKPVN